MQLCSSFRLTVLVMGFFSPIFAGVKLTEVVLKEGAPITLMAGPEREMMIYSQRPPMGKFQVPFEVFDNSCNDKIGVKGLFYGGYLNVPLSARWTKHPSPTKVGTQVEIISKDQNGQPFNFPFSANVFVTSLNKDKKPKLAAGLPVDQWKADNYTWLPGGKETPPESLYISRWDVELMLPNPETGINENRTLGTYTGITVKRNALNQMENIKTVQAGMDPILGFFQGIPVGDYWALALPVNRSEFCEVALKPKLSLDFKDDPTLPWNLYLLGSDEAIELSEQNLFYFIFKFPNQFEVE